MDRDIFRQNLGRVAYATVDQRAADTFVDHGGGHHASPHRCLGIPGTVPDHECILGQCVQHLTTIGHFAGDLRIGRAFHGERNACDRSLRPQCEEQARKRPIQKREFAQYIAHDRRLQLFVAFEQFGGGNRERCRLAGLIALDEALDPHHAGYVVPGTVHWLLPGARIAADLKYETYCLVCKTIAPTPPKAASARQAPLP